MVEKTRHVENQLSQKEYNYFASKAMLEGCESQTEKNALKVLHAVAKARQSDEAGTVVHIWAGESKLIKQPLFRHVFVPFVHLLSKLFVELEQKPQYFLHPNY